MRRARRRLERWRRKYAELRFRSYKVTHRYGGRALVVHIADPTSRDWYDRDMDMPAEVAVLRERGRLRPGARVFDLGAHQAVIALLLAGSVEPGGEVVAVEAAPFNVRVARRNVAVNGCTNVAIVPAAVSDRDGTIWFDDAWNGSVSEAAGDGVCIEAVTIDTLTERHGTPDVLFIDVEGFEAHALRGAARTLAAHRPDLFVEVHVDVGLHRFGTVADVLSQVPSGYELLVSAGEGAPFVPIGAGDDIMTRRFFLVALAPRPTEITAHD